MTDAPTGGPLFGDRYQPIRHIARGGMAQVYLAQDTLLDRPVALKVLFPELSVDESFVQRFRREARAAANLTHPNIVSIYDWGQGDHTYFIVMEYVDGETLSARIRRGPLDPDQAAIVAIATAGALSFAHKRQVIHRDVKPGNVLIDRSGQVKVADFGIARAVGTAEDLTQAGAVMGTATYFSPEQAQGQAVDARSDVYSLGVVLYEMAAGRPPFQADSPVAIAYKHVREEPAGLRSVNPAVPAAYAAIVGKAMAKDPADRYQTADELRQDLERFRAGQPLVGAAALLAGGAAGRAADEATIVAGARRTVTASGAEATGVLGAGALAAGALTAAGAVPTTQVQRPVGAPAGDGSYTTVEREVGRRPPVPPRHTRWGLWAALTAVLVLALAALAYFVGRDLGAFGTARVVPVPSVAGDSPSAAKARLGKAGFHHVADSVITSTVKQGKVVGTRPPAGALLSTSRTIVVEVSGGPGTVKMPDVANEPQRQAVAQLYSDGLKVSETTEPSSSVHTGYVIRTSPPAGTGVARGGPVQVVVSSGQKLVPVPSVTGKSPVAAAFELGAKGFRVNPNQITEPSSSIPAGEVTRTSPAAGTDEKPGTPVTIYVSSGPATATVPYVTNDTRSQAAAAIRAAGLVPQFTTVVVSNPAQNGLVVSTDPPANAAIRPGKTVTVDIGSYTAPSSTTTTPSSTTTGTSGTSGISGTS